MDINKKLVKQNFTKGRGGKKIEYLVIHDTGNEAPLAHAEAHFNYFNNEPRPASAHYFVDEKQILQIIEDENTAWHCGDGKGKYGITNSNSIGIEICINDGDYTTEIAKTIELVRHLMQKHNIPIENVVRHYDASRKNCPASMSANNWEAWKVFKKQLEPNTAATNKVKVNIKGKVIYLDGFMQNDINYVGIRQIVEALGHNVGWDNDKKVVLIK